MPPPIFPLSAARATIMAVRWQGLAFAVLAYICLDFGSPMVPGAVQFVHGALEIVEGSHGREADTVPLARPGGPSEALGTLNPRRAMTALARPRPPTQGLPFLARRPLSPSGKPPASSDDD